MPKEVSSKEVLERFRKVIEKQKAIREAAKKLSEEIKREEQVSESSE